jgi:hypothetical protein
MLLPVSRFDQEITRNNFSHVGPVRAAAIVREQDSQTGVIAGGGVEIAAGAF